MGHFWGASGAHWGLRVLLQSGLLSTWRARCGSFLAMTCFLIRGYSILPKKKLHESHQVPHKCRCMHSLRWSQHLPSKACGWPADTGPGKLEKQGGPKHPTPLRRCICIYILHAPSVLFVFIFILILLFMFAFVRVFTSACIYIYIYMITYVLLHLNLYMFKDVHLYIFIIYIYVYSHPYSCLHLHLHRYFY